MITKRFQKDDAASVALYSDCATYRYALTRVWDGNGRKLTLIMLNPSKATERHNDPTIERCERRARALGFGAFCAVNIFALRETDPQKMRRHPDPEGPHNLDVLFAHCTWADAVIAAWGVHGAHLDQGARIAERLLEREIPLLCFGRTKAGHPRHPLYIPYSAQPEPWSF